MAQFLGQARILILPHTSRMPAAEIFAFLELEQIILFMDGFMDGHYLYDNGVPVKVKRLFFGSIRRFLGSRQGCLISVTICSMAWSRDNLLILNTIWYNPGSL